MHSCKQDACITKKKQKNPSDTRSSLRTVKASFEASMLLTSSPLLLISSQTGACIHICTGCHCLIPPGAPCLHSRSHTRTTSAKCFLQECVRACARSGGECLGPCELLKGKERNTFLQAMVMSHGETMQLQSNLRTCQGRRGLAAQQQPGMCVPGMLAFTYDNQGLFKTKKKTRKLKKKSEISLNLPFNVRCCVYRHI